MNISNWFYCTYQIAPSKNCHTLKIVLNWTIELQLPAWTEDDEVGELWYIGVINSRQLQDQTKPNCPSTISHFPLLGLLLSILGLIFLLFHYFLFYGRNVVLVSPIQSNLLWGVLYYIINFTLSYYIIYFEFWRTHR